MTVLTRIDGPAPVLLFDLAMLRATCGIGVAVATGIGAVRPALAQHRATLQSVVFSRGVTEPHLTSTLGAAPPLQQPRRPSESARLGLQFVAASAGAVGGGLATYYVLRDVSETRVVGDEGYTRSGNIGYLVGSFAGATLGAHLVGTRMGGKSPLWATSLGALVGTVPLIALGVDEPFLPLIGLALGWIPQGALAAGGFSMGDSR